MLACARALARAAVERLEQIIADLELRTGEKREAATAFATHQPNPRLVTLLAKQLGSAVDKFPAVARKFGNLGSSTCGTALALALENQRASQSGQPAQVLLDCLLPDPPDPSAPAAPGAAPQPLSVWLDADSLAQALQPALAQVVACAQLCVQRSGLDAVDEVYLTGGSSALRPLVDALQQAMPQAKLVPGNRFGGVAAGLAVTGWSR